MNLVSKKLEYHESVSLLPHTSLFSYKQYFI